MGCVHADAPGDAVGVFDSGVGGLTVLRQIALALPDEPLLYLGDTARVPYGTKSPDTVVRYARACTRLLVERGVKLLVVACNTASAYALDVLREEVDVPVIGVVEPGAARAVSATRNGRIGVVGTAGTIASGQYTAAITARMPDADVYTQACPLFVPLAEEGWTAGPVPRQVAERYLAPVLAANVDTLVLGCTHYPLLKGVVGEVAGPGVTLVDSAEATAAVVAETIAALGLAGGVPGGTMPRYLVTDAPGRFEEVGARFLGQSLAGVEWVDFK